MVFFVSCLAGIFFAALLSFFAPRWRPKQALTWLPLGRRFVRVKQFCAVCNCVLWDLAEALQEDPSLHSLVALSPLIHDVRKRGEQLLAEQGSWHRLILRSWEQNLVQKVQALIQAEKWLKFNLTVVPIREAS